MAGEIGLFKFISPRVRLQPIDVKAAATWGVAAASTANLDRPGVFGETRTREMISKLSKAKAFQYLH